MKLIKMTDFVLDQDITLADSRFKILNYASFLNRPLELGMFFPCDENGKILSNNVSDENYFGVHVYNEAKKRVLFEGFEIMGGALLNCAIPILIIKDLHEHIIEDLVNYNFTLTELAKKQIGL